MRSRCSSSAALVDALALAGCGGDGDAGARNADSLPPRLARLFDYDRDAPLDVRHAAPARLYIQGAQYDEGVPPREVEALIAAAPRPVAYKWYPTTHTFEPATFRDQVAWLRDTLPLRPEAR